MRRKVNKSRKTTPPPSIRNPPAPQEIPLKFLLYKAWGGQVTPTIKIYL